MTISSEKNGILRIIFLILFIDLIGFSIIFPLFPALLKYYIMVDRDNYLLQMTLSLANNFFNSNSGNDYRVVLFGGVLATLYSFFQFIVTPIWGKLSDRIGRKPVLMISLSCTVIGYLIWIFAGSFTMLLLSRLIIAIMGGNISVATAVVSDITTKEDRSRGMAWVGIAFALGFIIGPALGGALSLIDLSIYFKEPFNWGINPFSAVAIFATFLSLFNLIYFIKSFKETLDNKNIITNKNMRTFNPVVLLRLLPYRGVNGVNYSHLFFIIVFSGMEFSLAFLVVERFSFSSMDNGLMFVFMGVLMSLVQGGYVRRYASKIGEKKMAIIGLIFIIPGFLLVGFCKNTYILYLGLAFFALGMSMIVPCLTALASLYTPASVQGEVMGVFRSLGSLGRFLGMILGCLIYWKYGPEKLYLTSAILMIIPLIIVSKLPNLKFT